MSAREKLQNNRGNFKLLIKLCFPQDGRWQVEKKQLKTMRAVSGKQLTLHLLQLKFPPRFRRKRNIIPISQCISKYQLVDRK